MQTIILILTLDLLVTGGAFAYFYFTRGVETAILAALPIFIALSPISWWLASYIPLYFARKTISESGITLNNKNALKTLAYINAVALPFNRVLTCNDYYVMDLVPIGMSQPSLLAMAASAEQGAENILGRAIYDTAKNRSLKISPSSDFKEFPGRGVEANVSRTLIRVGSPGWLEDFGTAISTHLRNRIDQLLVKGRIALLVATGRVARGIISLKDEINEDAKTFLEKLTKRHIETILLTAQPKKLINRIAKEFPLNFVRTNLTPEGKAREIQVFRAKGRIVAAIGTDLNDSPAMNTADVSISLAGGTLSHSKIQNSNFDFVIPNLKSFLYVHKIARNLVGITQINYWIAIASWILLLPPALLIAFNKLHVPFSPIIIIIAGAAIFYLIIAINSSRIR